MSGAGTYRTVAGRGQIAFSIRGSEFLGIAAPASSVDRAEAIIKTLRDDYPDASHHVPAYRVRDQEPDAAGYFLREWADDDGEPSGSAGAPLLNVLDQREVVNVVVVVIRYFGGTKLGVGGLARAYSRAGKEAITAAGIEERRPHRRLEITVEYDDSGTVRGILESENLAFDADYAATVSFIVEVPVTATDHLRDRLQSATSGRVDITTD